MQDDPLAQLRDIHMPVEPGWWPPAPGWWLLAVLVLLAIVLVVAWLVRSYRANAPKREALALLSQADRALADQQIEPSQYLNQCNALLKRLWVHAQGQVGAAELSGDGWLAYLDERSGGDQFTNGAGSVLGNQRFSGHPVEVTPALQTLLRDLLSNTRMHSASGDHHRD